MNKKFVHGCFVCGRMGEKKTLCRNNNDLKYKIEKMQKIQKKKKKKCVKKHQIPNNNSILYKRRTSTTRIIYTAKPIHRRKQISEL